MYSDLPMALSIAFELIGLSLLAWSSGKFILGAAALARNLGVSPFVVGMIVVGFGTSAPELLVSVFSSASGHTNLSLGNAYGSCIFNIAGILGISALIRPLRVKDSIPRVAVPVLLLITIISFQLLSNNILSRFDAIVLLIIFAVIMPVYCKWDASEKGGEEEGDGENLTTKKALFWTIIGLATMVGASHILVWGAVDIARALGVGELLIGLTIIAIGTSIPELASAIAATSRNEADLVLGNIVGSNLFNTLAVIGLAGVITPSYSFSKYILLRDLPILFLVTLLIWVFGRDPLSKRKDLKISRGEGTIWVVIFIAYMALTLYQEIPR